MGAYDTTARVAANTDPASFMRRLLRDIDETLTFSRWERTQGSTGPTGPERTPDLVAVLDDARNPARPTLIVGECQTRYDPEKPATLLLECATWYERFRVEETNGRYRVIPAFVYLTTTGESNVDSSLAGGFGFGMTPIVWDVPADSAATTLVEIEAGGTGWGMLAWVTLMVGADDPELARRWRRIRDALVPAGPRADELTGLALTLGELKGVRQMWQIELDANGRTESPYLNEMIDRGAVRELRVMLLETLGRKFPAALSSEVENTVNGQTSIPLLRRWRDAIIDAKSYADFEHALRHG